MGDLVGNGVSPQQQSNAMAMLAKNIENAKIEVLSAPKTTGATTVLDRGRRADKFASETYDVKNYCYPSDLLGADSQYGGNYIVFYINIQNDSQISVSGAAVNENDSVGSEISKSSSGHRSDIKTEETTALGMSSLLADTVKQSGMIPVAVGAVGGVVGAAATVAGGFAGALITAGAGGVAAAAALGAGIGVVNLLNQIGSATRATKRLKTAIALHTPNAISTSYGAMWDADDTAKAQMGALRFGDTNIADIVKTVAMTKILKMENVGGLVGAQLGQVANPKKEMMFKSVNFREFTFDYKFAPRSVDELNLVENIIKMFKFHMHPEYIEGSNNYLFLYPSEFDILYYNNGDENRHLPRYTSCALTSVNVQYTPNAYFTAFGEGSARGAPTEINMTLQFRELALLTKREIMDGY